MSDPSDVASDERVRDAITLAKNMRNNGASIEMIEARLVGRGFDEKAVEAVLRQVPKEEPDNVIVRPDPTPGGRRLLVVFGLMVSALGLVLVIGNRTGLAPTLPFFGTIVIALGVVIMAAGRS